MKPTGLDLFRQSLLGRPSVGEDVHVCSVCGRPADDMHHVVPKGIGGMSRELERQVPRIRLCGSGNQSGCHGLAHSHRLHFAWDGERGGWLYLISPYPCPDWRAWEERSFEFMPLPAWERGNR